MKDRILVRFRIPQLKHSAVIVHKFKILDSLPDDTSIGRDLMTAFSQMLTVPGYAYSLPWTVLQTYHQKLSKYIVRNKTKRTVRCL